MRHGWRGNGLVMYSSTPWGRKCIESEFITRIQSGNEDPKKLSEEIMKADLDDEVIANLILNIGLRK